MMRNTPINLKVAKIVPWFQRKIKQKIMLKTELRNS